MLADTLRVRPVLCALAPITSRYRNLPAHALGNITSKMRSRTSPRYATSIFTALTTFTSKATLPGGSSAMGAHDIRSSQFYQDRIGAVSPFELHGTFASLRTLRRCYVWWRIHPTRIQENAMQMPHLPLDRRKRYTQDALQYSKIHHSKNAATSEIQRLGCDEIPPDQVQCCRELLLELLATHDFGSLGYLPE